MTIKKHKSEILKLFVLAFVMMIIIQLPLIIINKGYFIYTGDYNYQHISFSMHAYDMIHSGFVNYDAVTSLGCDFLSSYGHIVFTPFFLLLLLLPSAKAAAIALPVITALKTATAAATAFVYIKKYVKNTVPAYTGALLYAFSGFQSFNLVFGSFHDITAWFPLMLVCLDDYIYNNKKGRFAVIVAFMAALNAFFFYGQVIFILLYFIVKCISGEYKITLKKFMGLAVESIIGVLISAVLLYPGVITLMSNSRVSSFIYGMDAVSYSDRSIVWRILQSIFMMPDTPNMTVLFDGSNTWSSISLYLPCVGVVFVAAFIKKHHKAWETILLSVCFIMAIIPALNSIFFMFNSAFYARWYYMPLLIMAMVTAKAADMSEEKDIIFGIKLSGIAMCIFALIACLPGRTIEYNGDEAQQAIKFFQFPFEKIVFWRTLGFSGLFILIIYMLLKKHLNGNDFIKKISAVVVAGTVIINIIYLFDTDNMDKAYSQKFYSSAIEKPEIELNDGEFYRIYGQVLNANLIWNIPSMDNFVTIYPKSMNEFYDQFEIYKTQTAAINTKYYPVQALFSCKYYLNRSTGDDLNVENERIDIEGYQKKEIQPFYHIYENEYFIPMGYMFDYYITETSINQFVEKYAEDHPEDVKNSDEEDEYGNGETYNEKMSLLLSNSDRSLKMDFQEKYLQKFLVMMRAIVLADEDADKYSGIIPEITPDMLDNLDAQTYFSDCNDRKKMCCSEFNVTKDGFNAKIKSDKKNLVYFSVPYMDGWDAVVNGEKADIVKVNYGFMAVEVDNGDNTIEFSYHNNNFKTGALISVSGAALLTIYLSVCFFVRRKETIGKK